MSKVKLFNNFTLETFRWKWNGKSYTFKAGEKKYMPAYLAEHFAKHLANKVLEQKKDYASMSPKNPEQVPAFWELFNKGCIDENPDENGQDEAQLEVELLNKPKKTPKVDGAPEGEPNIILPPDADADDDEAENPEFKEDEE